MVTIPSNTSSDPFRSSRACGFVEHFRESFRCKAEDCREAVENRVIVPRFRCALWGPTVIHSPCRGTAVDITSIADSVRFSHQRERRELRCWSRSCGLPASWPPKPLTTRRFVCSKRPDTDSGTCGRYRTLPVLAVGDNLNRGTFSSLQFIGEYLRILCSICCLPKFP